MRIYFFRHGPAVARAQWNGEESERPLTAEGRQLVTEVAAALARSGLVPEAIISSPLARARESAEVLAGCLCAPCEIQVDKRLAPGFEPEQILKLLRDHKKAGTLVLVAQEPDLSRAVCKFVGRSRIAIRKAGVALVDVPDSAVLKGRLLGLLAPTLLADPPGQAQD